MSYIGLRQIHQRSGVYLRFEALRTVPPILPVLLASSDYEQFRSVVQPYRQDLRSCGALQDRKEHCVQSEYTATNARREGWVRQSAGKV